MSHLHSIRTVLVVLVAVSPAVAEILNVNPEPDFEANTAVVDPETGRIVLDLIPGDDLWLDELTIQFGIWSTIGQDNRSLGTMGEVFVSAYADQWAVNHARGDVVDASLGFYDVAGFAQRSAGTGPGVPPPWYYGHFGTGYVGLRITDDQNDSHYGWARVTADVDAMTLVVHEWAYQSQADVPVTVGLIPGDANHDGTVDLQDFGLL